MKIYKPRRATVQRFESAREQLTAELGRSPTGAEMAERLECSRQRVAQLAEWLEAPLSTRTAGARVDLAQPIPSERDELEARLLLNFRRLYALELQGAARSDGELGLAAGYKGRPDQAAAEFRKCFTGARAPTVDICRKMARAFGVDPVEFWRPIDVAMEAGGETAWPLRSVLEVLVDAAGILLDEKNYDGQGWERLEYARRAAREYIGGREPDVDDRWMKAPMPPRVVTSGRGGPGRR